MIDISIKQIEREEPVFKIILTDKTGNRTRHTVSLSEIYFDNLTHGKISKLELIEMSFKFLLEQEPASAILSEFDLEDIMRYYPEYDRIIRDNIAKSNI